MMDYVGCSSVVGQVECGDSSPHGSESGDKSPHSTFGGLNDDQGRKLFRQKSRPQQNALCGINQHRTLYFHPFDLYTIPGLNLFQLTYLIPLRRLYRHLG